MRTLRHVQNLASYNKDNFSFFPNHDEKAQRRTHSSGVSNPWAICSYSRSPLLAWSPELHLLSGQQCIINVMCLNNPWIIPKPVPPLLPYPWKNCLPWNWPLVPTMLETHALSNFHWNGLIFWPTNGWFRSECWQLTMTRNIYVLVSKGPQWYQLIWRLNDIIYKNAGDITPVGAQ